MTLDQTDIRILKELQENADLSNVELARRVHLSPSPCLTRVRALNKHGFVRKQVVLVEPRKIGLFLNVFVFVSLKRQDKQALTEFEKRITTFDEVMECYLMSGDADYMLRVVTPGIEQLERFIVEQLAPRTEVEKIRSSFALKQVRYTTALPLDYAAKKRAAREGRISERSRSHR